MNEIELDIPQGTSKAIIEGKTPVPFKTFVSLILQRKVQSVFKKNQDDMVIVSSELLTALASAPDDRQEDRGKLVLVTFSVGILAGVFLAVASILGLLLLKIAPTMQDLGIVLGVIAGVVILGSLLQRSEKKSVFKEKLFEAMEKTTELISR